MSLIDYDNELHPQQSQSPTGLAAYDQELSGNPPPPPQQSVLTPISEQQTAEQNVQNGTGFWNDIKNLGINAAKDVPSILTGLGRLIVQAPIGAAVNGYDDLTGNQKPTTGFLGDSSKIASALPGAVAQIPGQIYNFGKELKNNPQQAIDEVGNSIYEHPVNALLTASGLGDLIGAGVKAVGGAADNAALNAATTAAGLTPEEAASATIANTSPLTDIGSQIQSGANAVNPINLGVQGVTAVKDVGGNATSKLLGYLTHTGSDGTNTIRTIANGGDLGDSAISGMRGVGTAEEQQAFKDAVNSIDQKNMSTGAVFDPTALNTVRSQVNDSLAENGLHLNVLTPEEQGAIQDYFKLHEQGIDPANPNALEDSGYAQNLRMGPVGDILKKYFSDAPTNDSDYLKNILYGNKYKTGVDGMTSDEEDAILKKTLDNNGLISIAPSAELATRYSPKDVQALMQTVVKPLYQLGTKDGFEANAKNLNNLKVAANNLYTENSPFVPIPGNKKLLNEVSTSLQKAVSAPLREHPEYQAVMDRYKAYHAGQNMSGLLPSSLQSMLQGNAAIPTEALGAYALSKVLNPIAGGLFSVMSSPRAVGEIANVYGKTARAVGTVTGPVTQAAKSGAITALLNLIGGNTK